MLAALAGRIYDDAPQQNADPLDSAQAVSQIQNRFITRKDLPPEQTWELAEWCVSRGATEFTVELMSLDGSTPTFLEQVELSLSPYQLADAARERMVTLAGNDRIRPTRIWRADHETLGILKRFFNDGLFGHMTGDPDAGWLEDPTFYRDGQVMLGIVSHEGEGVLRLTDREHSEIASKEIASRSSPEWI